MQEATVVTKVDRSPRGLVEALFNSIDKLNSGLATTEEVRAVSHTARTIANVARLEMEAAKLADTLGRNVKIASLPGLGMRRGSEDPNDAGIGTSDSGDGK